jgi:multidrug efflux pump subunit AcrA (membrane-fusion protein)
MGGKEGAGPGGPAEAPVFAVNTSTAAEGLISDYLALSGDIVAASTVDTFPDISGSGKVTRLYVTVGQQVQRNQVIADVDPSRPGMDYLISQVKAPVSGTIVALPAQVGQTVSPSVSVARIAAGNVSQGALEIKLYVAERFLSRISLKQPCEITLDAYPSEKFQGYVSELSPVVDPASRTMEITVRLENPDNKLRAGMFAKVKIIIEQKSQVVKIPESAVVDRFGEKYVFVVENGAGGFVVRKRVITPGINIDGVLEVEQGLSPGQEFVVRGQTLLEDGSRVNIIDRTPPLSAN